MHFAIGNFIRDALTVDAITVSGDGTPLRTYLDQTDLAHLMRGILAPDKPVRILGHPEPGAARNHYVPDISKAQEEHGLSVTVPLAEAIRRTGDSAEGLGPAERIALS